LHIFDPLSLQSAESVKMVVYLRKNRLSPRLWAKLKKYLITAAERNQGGRSNGTEGGEVIELRAMET